jgi:DNA-binding CsgD family transcriptional regulator/N-acetylneuraminic acid mutarotase
LEHISVTLKTAGGNQHDELSEREKEILRLVATGASNKEIAGQLFISVNTVKVHLRNIFAKIGASSRTEAAMTAVQIGLAPAPGSAQLESDSTEQAIDLQLGSVPEASRTAIPVEVEHRGQGIRWDRAAVAGLFLLVVVAVVWVLNRPNAPAAQINPANAEGLPRWEELANLPEPRYGFATASNENFIYVISGQSDLGLSKSVLRYDTATDLWAYMSDKPTPVSEISAVVIGGKIYIPGGKLDTDRVSAKLEIFNLETNTWEEGADLPKALSAYSLAAMDGMIYLFGGWDGAKYLADVYVYNPQSDQWTSAPAMPTARAFSGAAVSGSKIYIIGGSDGRQILTTNEIFLPDKLASGEEAWQPGPELPEGRSAMGVSSVADIIYVVGGKVEGASSYPALAFFSNSGEWQVIQEPPQPIGAAPGLISQGVYLYSLGGQSEERIASENLRYQAVYTFTLPIIRK